MQWRRKMVRHTGLRKSTKAEEKPHLTSAIDECLVILAPYQNNQTVLVSDLWSICKGWRKKPERLRGNNDLKTQAAVLRRALSLRLLYSSGHLWSYHGLCFSNNWPCVGRCSWRAKIKAASVGAADSNWEKQMIAPCPPVFNLPPYSKHSNNYKFTTWFTTNV